MPFTRSVEAALTAASLNIELIEYRWSGELSAARMNPVHTLSRLIAPASLDSHWQAGDELLRRGGGMAFIPANFPIHMHLLGEQAKFWLFQFGPDRLKALMGEEQTGDKLDFRICGDVKSAPLDRIIQRLVSEVTCPGFATELLVDSLSTVAIIELSRYFHDIRDKEVKQRGGLTPWQIRRLTDYVESSSNAPVLVADLAKLCGISVGHLQRAFKQSTGRTLYNYVEQVRLDKAKALLMSKKIPIKKIAVQLGFNNASGFSIAFQRAAGETPSNFRKRAS